MLTIMECINAKKTALVKKSEAKIIDVIYDTILDNASMGRTKGAVSIDCSDDIWVAYCNLREIDYKIKHYTQADKTFIEDGELIIEYDLEGFSNE